MNVQDDRRSDDQSLDARTSEKLKKIIANANYDVYNLAILRNPNDWQGRLVSFSGVITEELLVISRPNFFIVNGRINDYLISFVVYLDHSVPAQKMINEDIEIISRGKSVRVFAEVIGIEEFMTESGTKKKMPTAECIAIYNQSDYNLRKPIWLKNNF
jgi:hypothetical protein